MERLSRSAVTNYRTLAEPDQPFLWQVAVDNTSASDDPDEGLVIVCHDGSLLRRLSLLGPYITDILQLMTQALDELSTTPAFNWKSAK